MNACPQTRGLKSARTKPVKDVYKGCMLLQIEGFALNALLLTTARAVSALNFCASAACPSSAAICAVAFIATAYSMSKCGA